ncbi:PREDICTED: mediator of RNA polymerase II transcription subunit 28 [Vollenhovia emeryi]|uniref:mediator of RNA polymerase II transcription subunit 28 n=1 Tax=Vollenhovia emeryi TaxID=411798 RepID=UPI0005F3B3FC|nr:PREDICTED: mediator of RNA polymerase II transcription subunit 28 [Vollenhovia emeryi]
MSFAHSRGIESSAEPGRLFSRADPRGYNTVMATPTNSGGNIVDEFEESFQQCLSILTKDEGLGNSGTGAFGGGLMVDKDEGRAEMEQATMRFIDLARQMEAFFLQKRFLLSALKPELIVKEDISDLRVELARKEELIKRHNDKIAVWQNMLSDLQGWAQSPAQGPAPSGLPNGNQSGQNPQTASGSGNASMQQQQQILQHQQQLQQQLQQQQQQQHPQLQQQLQQQMQHSLQSQEIEEEFEYEREAIDSTVFECYGALELLALFD